MHTLYIKNGIELVILYGVCLLYIVAIHVFSAKHLNLQ